MLAGPIFSLETVTSARRPRYFAARVLYAAALLAALCSVYSAWTDFERELRIHEFAEFGAAFFNSFAALQLLVVIGLGPGLTAGTIAQERERRTIEYLFATDLSNGEIVLGKLAARLLLLLYLVLVGLPILAIAMLLGGISPTRLVLVFLMTASTMLMVTSLSIAISVWSTRAREAVTRAYMVLLALLLLPPLATNVRIWIPPWLDTILGPLVAAGLLINPLWTLAYLGTTDPVGLSGIWSAGWPLVAAQAALGAVCLAAAVWGVRRVHLHGSGAAKEMGATWPRLWRPQLEHHPMIWKELFAERAVPRLGLAGRIAVFLIVAGVLAPTLGFFIYTVGSPYSIDEFEFYAIMMGTAVGSAGLLLMAARGATLVTSEKERDTWTTLLSTPLEAREIVTAKILGNLFALRLVCGLLAVLWGLASLREPKLVFAAAATLCILLLGAVCVSLIGLLFSASCNTSQRAMAWTLLVVLFLGGGYLLLCLPILIGAPVNGGEEIIVAGCGPFLLAFPGISTMEGTHGEEGITAAFVLGIIGYSCLTVFLWMAAVANFDKMADRREGSLAADDFRGRLNRLSARR